MSTPFQNRLVGTIIVAAVVIIFLPDLLDGEKNSHQYDFEAIPKSKPFSGDLKKQSFPENKLVEQKTAVISSEKPVDDVVIEHITPTPNTVIDKKASKVEKVIANAAPVNSSVTVKHNPKKKLPEKAVAKEAWVIHLGSFKDKNNVAQLLQKLKDKGYNAFTKPIKTKKGILTKVIIGPELIKSAMAKKLPELKKLTGIQGKVAYFSPTD